MKLKLGVFFSCMLMCFSQTVKSQRLAEQLRLRDIIFCIEIAVFEPPWEERMWIPVGCEVIDCCEGCPGPPMLDLEIRWEATPGMPMILSFQNLDEKAKSKVVIEGKAEWNSNNQLRLHESGVRLKHVPQGVLLSSQPEVNKELTSAMLKDADADADQDGKSKKLFARVDINQYMGKYMVNNHTLRYRYYFCRRPPGGSEDKIRLTNNTGGDDAVILFDGNRSGCENDVALRTTNEVGMGNVLSNGACNAETFVFSDDNAFARRVPSTEWTNAIGNIQTFTLQPRLVVPTTVWLVQNGSLARAQADVALTNQLFNENHVGLQMDAIFTNVSNNVNATNLLSTMRCEDFAAIRASAFFTAGRLNVYYSVNVLSGGGGNVRGRACFLSDNQDIVGVASIAVPETLAHEFGHSCTLRHDDDDNVVYASAFNLMISGGVNRNNITEGQAFRVNMNPNEDGHQNILQQFGLMVGLRNCEENAISNVCPPVIMDVVPN